MRNENKQPDERAAFEAMPPDGDKDYWRTLYMNERECRQQWQARATQQATLQDGAAHAVGAIAALKSLEDLTTQQATTGDERAALTDAQVEAAALEFVKKPGMQGYIEPGDLIDFVRTLPVAVAGSADVCEHEWSPIIEPHKECDKCGEVRRDWDAVAGSAGQAPKLTVWYGTMPESNGKTNYTAILHKGDVTRGITLDMSEYPDRVRYEADRMRWMIGELEKEPFICDYDTDKHSGYTAPTAPSLATDAGAVIQALQKALAYWMPKVFDERSAHDAYLLVGYEGETEARCWGDEMVAAAPRWTSASESLPTEPGWYLAILKPDNDWGLMSDTALQVEFDAYTTKPKAFTCFYDYHGDEDITEAVTHWMPMPTIDAARKAEIERQGGEA